MNKKIILAIRSLNRGGAERQFIILAKELAKNGFDITVVVFYNGAWDSELIANEKIKFVSLEKRSRWDNLTVLFRYIKLIRSHEFYLIYSFLPEMNIFSLIAKFFSSKKPKLFWGIRASDMSGNYGFASDLILLIQAKLSHFADLIIFNSNCGKEAHIKSGFKPKKTAVIFNAIDTDFFCIDTKKREEFRLKCHLKDDDIAVGISARIDKMKGYEIFAKAAKIVLEKRSNLYFFVAGNGDEKIKNSCIEILGGNPKVIWLGNLDDMPSFYNGIDIAVSSSSFGEGFSNSIAEAMSCGKACVVTDVGDSAFIVGDCGAVCKPNDHLDLAEKLLDLIASHKTECSRERIVNNFSISQMVLSVTNEI